MCIYIYFSFLLFLHLLIIFLLHLFFFFFYFSFLLLLLSYFIIFILFNMWHLVKRFLYDFWKGMSYANCCWCISINDIFFNKWIKSFLEHISDNVWIITIHLFQQLSKITDCHFKILMAYLYFYNQNQLKVPV